MRRILFLTATGVVLHLAWSPVASAQKSGLLPIAYQDPPCFPLVETLPRDADNDPKVRAQNNLETLKGQVGTLRRCLDATATRARIVLDTIRAERGSNDSMLVTIRGKPRFLPIKSLGGYLITEHAALKLMHKWVTRLEKLPGERTEDIAMVIAAYHATSAIVHDGLDQLGLGQLFSAAVITGPVIGSGGQVEGKPTDDVTKASAHLVWESKHFGDESVGFMDVSIRGRFGFVPALTLVQEQTSGTPPDATEAQTVFQEGLAWELGGRWNFQSRTRTSSEVSIVGKVGQTILGTQSVLVENGANSVLAVPVANNTHSAEFFFEGGLEFNLYNNPLDVVHAEGSAVSPAFSAGLSYKLDNRFKQEGALVAFDHPKERIVFRFMLDAIKVLDKRDLAEKGKVFTFGFGVEHEFARRGDVKVPSGTKLIFRGDLDLLKALRGR